MKLPILPPAVNQKRLKDGETQQALDNVVTPANVVLAFLRLVFTYVANVLALTVDNLTVNLSATIKSLSATNATIATLTTTTETVTTSNVTTLNVSGTSTLHALNATTGAFSGAITGASYSGGPISGTTGNFSGITTVGQLNLTQPNSSVSDWQIYENASKNLLIGGSNNSAFITASGTSFQQNSPGGNVTARAVNYATGAGTTATVEISTGTRDWSWIADSGADTLRLRDSNAGIDRITVSNAGAISFSGPIVSSTGFKAVVGPFTYYNAGTGNTGGTMRYTVYDNVSTTGVYNLSFVAPFAGSILAVSANLNGPITQATTVTANVAGSSSFTTTIASGGSTASTTVSKGTYAFTPGQLLNVTISWPASQTYVVCSAFLVIEMAA